MTTPPGRRVGLSYRNSPGHLLKSLKSYTETTTTTTTATTTTAPKPESKLRGGRSQLKVPEPVPEDIFAPPLASSDVEDDENAENADASLESGRQPQHFDDSSDSDRPTRGAISSTNFTSSSQNVRRQSLRTRHQETEAVPEPSKESDELQPADRKRKRLSDTSNNKSKSKKNAFAVPNLPPPSSSASHLTNGHGFTRKAKVKATFGKKGSGSQESRKSRVSEDFSAAKFLPPPEFNNETPRKSSMFIVPDSISPVKKDPPKRLRLLQIQQDSEPESDDDTAVFSQPKSVTDDTEPVKSEPRGKRKDNPLRSKRNSLASKKEKEAAPKSSSPVPAKFVMPAQLSDFKMRKSMDGGDINDNDLSDASSSGLSSLGSLFPEKDNEESGEAPCPWCGAAVDMKKLKEFSKGKRLNVRMQTAFCDAHKRTSAVATYESKSYPEIKWASLIKRFKSHREHLLGIINGEESHYRTALADKISLGQARSMDKEENLNPGYYGPRGFNLMCDYLVKEFGDMLKKKAIHDKVIAGRGSSAFIQLVLVAELGVQLIMEDMHVSPEEAREILEESKALGELVHDELSFIA